MDPAKNILIIAPYAFGYTKHINDALNTYKGVKSEIKYLDRPEFKYENLAHKIQNFVLKCFGKNLKKSFVFDRIKNDVSQMGHQDIIFIIRPDILDDATLNFLKEKSHQFIAYYYDSTRRFARKSQIISLFDTVYSYDRLDVNDFDLQFLTNYIFEESSIKNHDYLFFNISTNDYRLPLLESLAAYLKKHQWTYKMLVYNGSQMASENVEVITTQKSIKEVSELIKKAKIIVEIQRTEQVGLSFRIFEALGHDKKLITTNSDIVNYDFYNPQNILVVDEHNIQIPDEFVNSPYVKIADSILSKYKIEKWVKPIFDL